MHRADRGDPRQGRLPRAQGVQEGAVALVLDPGLTDQGVEIAAQGRSGQHLGRQFLSRGRREQRPSPDAGLAHVGIQGIQADRRGDDFLVAVGLFQVITQNRHATSQLIDLCGELTFSRCSLEPPGNQLEP